MTNRYEALLILNVKGSDEGAKEIIEKLEGEFRKDGAAIEQIQRMGKHQFSYAAGELDNGYYVNFVFAAEPAAIDKLKAKLRLDADVYRQHYVRLPDRAPQKAAAAAE
jgi:small subunit ribosomal protein S6